MLKKIKSLTRDTKNWVNEKADKIPKMKNYKTLTMCESCYSFRYRNSWHFKKPDWYSQESNKGHEIPVIFTQCSACLEQENALFEKESELVLSKRWGM